MKKEKRTPFGLSHNEIELLLDTLPFDISSMQDVLRDPGYMQKSRNSIACTFKI
jgi:hypothetical protein